MNTIPFLHYVGWSAYLSAAATIVTLVAAILFFSVGEPFGTISDASSVLQVLFMVPLAIALYWLLPTNMRTPGFLAAALGILGMLVIAVGQSLLVVGRINFQQSLKFFPAAVAIGIWLLGTSYLALAGELWPRGLAWASLLAGAGYVLTVVGFLIGGQQNPLYYLGSLVLLISFPIWAIWLGRLLLAGTLSQGAG